MREIKFRCWDKENKEMLDVEYLHWDDCTREFSIRTTMYTDYFDIEDMILMQYVGLKDKNGKEIYEGDIVKIDKEDYKYIVKFYDGCFVGINKYDEHYEQAKILGNLFTLELEVIGNIHDNPELLEDK